MEKMYAVISESMNFDRIVLCNNYEEAKRLAIDVFRKRLECGGENEKLKDYKSPLYGHTVGEAFDEWCNDPRDGSSVCHKMCPVSNSNTSIGYCFTRFEKDINFTPWIELALYGKVSRHLICKIEVVEASVVGE